MVESVNKFGYFRVRFVVEFPNFLADQDPVRRVTYQIDDNAIVS